MSSLPVSIKRIGSKTIENRWRHRFPHYKSMGAFCCHRNHSFDPIWPKTLCSLFPTPVMLHIKFDQYWPTGFRDVQVWMCGRRRRTTDRWYTINSPCEPSAQVSYKPRLDNIVRDFLQKQRILKCRISMTMHIFKLRGKRYLLLHHFLCTQKFWHKFEWY